VVGVGFEVGVADLFLFFLFFPAATHYGLKANDPPIA